MPYCIGFPAAPQQLVDDGAAEPGGVILRTAGAGHQQGPLVKDCLQDNVHARGRDEPLQQLLAGRQVVGVQGLRARNFAGFRTRRV